MNYEQSKIQCELGITTVHNPIILCKKCEWRIKNKMNFVKSETFEY